MCLPVLQLKTIQKRQKTSKEYSNKKFENKPTMPWQKNRLQDIQQ